MLKVGTRTALGLLAVGIGLVVAGVALIYPPAALIVAGAGLFGLVWFGVEV